MGYRAVLYAAVSDPRQATEEHASLDEQLRSGRAICEEKGWQIVDTIRIEGHSRYYTKLSELTASCPEYARMIALIESGNIDLIVCQSYDRVWRTDALRAAVSSLCQAYSVYVYSCAERVPPENQTAAFWLQLITGGVAQLENEWRRQRTQRGLKGRAEKRGLTMSLGRQPYGYVKIHPQQPNIIDEQKARWVRFIYEERLKGKGYHEIANSLNERLVPSPGGSIWRHDMVRRVLRNPTYTGLILYRRYEKLGGKRKLIEEDIFEGNHEAIIPRDLWDQVQAINRNRKRDYTYSDRPAHLLTGLMRCGFCGDGMVYAWISKRWMTIRCGRYARSKGRECVCNSHIAHRVEAFVLEQVQALVANPDAFIETNGQSEASAQISLLEGEIAGLDKRLGAIYDAIETRRFSLDELADRQDALTERRRQCRAELAALRGQTDQVAQFIATARSLRDSVDQLPTMPESELRAIYKRLIRRIILQRDHDPDPIIEWLS